MNEVEPYVDMLGSGMVLMVFREFDGQLIVQEKSGWFKNDVEELGDEGSKPQSFLGCVGDSHVFCFSS